MSLQVQTLMGDDGNCVLRLDFDELAETHFVFTPQAALDLANVLIANATVAQYDSKIFAFLTSDKGGKYEPVTAAQVIAALHTFDPEARAKSKLMIVEDTLRNFAPKKD